MTKINSNSVAQTSRTLRARASHDLRGPEGRNSGRAQPMSATVIMYMVAARIPGRMPAMNSLPMSCSVMMPYTARTVDGGSMAPSVPPAAITPAANDSGYPYRRISGYATVEKVAAVATEEPDMAANPPQAAMVAMPSPPRR